jgi:penicillin-binding protein 2
VFAGFPYPIACKTGTSQSDIAGRILNNAVFVAYAPAEKPRLAVAVVVPEGNYGAWNAAPIARKIFDAYDLSVGLNGTPRVVMPEPLPATAEAIPGVPSVTP